MYVVAEFFAYLCVCVIARLLFFQLYSFCLHSGIFKFNIFLGVHIEAKFCLSEYALA